MLEKQETLGEMIVRARKRAGIKSQTELGQRIGASKDQVGRLERDETPPTVPEWIAIARETDAPWLLEMLVGLKIVFGQRPVGFSNIAHAA